jgi:hypothetical protein
MRRKTTMDTQGNEQVIRMLEGALEKARQGRGRGAVLLTVKPNGMDVTASFAHEEDLRVAIAKCDEAKASLNDLLDAVERQKVAGPGQTDA